MRIKHRFGFSRDKDIYNCLDKIGMPYEKGEDVYKRQEEDLFESDGITDQSIYLSFHETAQVLASKQIHLASSKKGWPILELSLIHIF